MNIYKWCELLKNLATSLCRSVAVLSTVEPLWSIDDCAEPALKSLTDRKGTWQTHLHFKGPSAAVDYFLMSPPHQKLAQCGGGSRKGGAKQISDAVSTLVEDMGLETGSHLLGTTRPNQWSGDHYSPNAAGPVRGAMSPVWLVRVPELNR